MCFFRFHKVIVILIFLFTVSVFSATVGYTTVYTSTSTNTSRRAHQFTMPGNGQITSISMYHNAASGSYQTQFGIYSNGTNNLPNTKLASTAKTTVSTTTGWQTINLTSPISVTAGTKIWLAWMYQNSSGSRRYGAVTGSPGYVTGSGTWSTTGDNMPSSFGTATTSTGTNFSIYATYTPAPPSNPIPNGVNTGDMLYWNGTAWALLTVDITNKVLTLDKNKTPTWADNNIIRDYEGNIYHTVTLGTQTWTVENWKCTKFNDGTPIPNITDDATWLEMATPAYCWYNNDPANKIPYGALYNWYTIDPANTKKLAPAGWHVPSEADWDILKGYLISHGYNSDGTLTGNKIAKCLAEKRLWVTSPDPNAIGNDLFRNNISGFSALPGGFRQYFGSFEGIGYESRWWTVTPYQNYGKWGTNLYTHYEYLGGSWYIESSGFSIRLVKDN